MAPKRRLGEILVEAGMIDDFQLRSALSDQKRWGRPLGLTLLKLGFIEEGELVHFLSRQLDVPIVDLRGKRIAPEVLAALPIQMAEKLRCIPLFQKSEGGRDVLFLGMEDPTDLHILDDLAFRTGIDIRPVLVGPNQLTEAIERHYHKLEWDGEDVAETEAGALLEPGDTAPMVFAGEVPEPDVIHPEMFVRPEPLAPPQGPGKEQVLDPPAEPAIQTPHEREFAMDPPSPSPAAPAESPARESRTRQLGPEFIVDSEPGVAETPPAEPAKVRPRDVPTRTILRAVTHLLIDAGVFTREELLERTRALVAEDAGSNES